MHVKESASGENKPIRDIAYETLKQEIITGKIPAGTRMIETCYAEKLHISRTPLREAMRRLELDGLVEYHERKGVIVSAFTAEDVEEVFMIRNALIELILPSVVARATERDIDGLEDILRHMDVSENRANADELAVYNRMFHRRMEWISDKVRILRVIDSQEEYIKRFSVLAISSIVRRTDAHQEHHKMVELLREKNLEGLLSLMRHHLKESKETCLKVVGDHREAKPAGQREE